MIERGLTLKFNCFSVAATNTVLYSLILNLTDTLLSLVRLPYSFSLIDAIVSNARLDFPLPLSPVIKILSLLDYLS